MNGSAKRSGLMSMAIVAILAGVVFVAGCGGSDSGSDDTSAAAGTAGGPGGGMFASLTDDQKQCIEDAGVTLPEAPSGDAPDGGEMPQGQPPEGMTPPDGAPQGGPPGDGQVPEGMEDMQKAMEKCGIDMPEPPEGGQSPSGDEAPATS